MSRLIQSILARVVLATRLIDAAWLLFSQVRSRLVLAYAPDSFYQIYNDITYSRQKAYQSASKEFRSDLFPFEEQAISQYFPPPPRTILVCAAGGGREALALARLGYEVLASEAARPLVMSLREATKTLPIKCLLGRYEDLPNTRSLDEPSSTVDLRTFAPFSATILGWWSFSHLGSDEICVETLRQVARLTRGPILLSWAPRVEGGAVCKFTVNNGFYRTFTEDAITGIAQQAELRVACMVNEGKAHAVLISPDDAPSPKQHANTDFS